MTASHAAKGDTRERTPSIYQRILGADFERLHPRIRERFGFSSQDGIGAVGRGVMDEVYRGAAFTLPFLRLGAWRRIMFPENGRNVPFTIHNYAFVDPLGRETITWIRTFDMPKRQRRFDAYMIHSESRGRIIDYLGTHQHLAVDIELSVDPGGGIRLRSGEQRFYEGPVGFRFPAAFTGIADVHEWFDDEIGRYRIQVDVTNPRWGPLFGYRGSFGVEWRRTDVEGVPRTVLARRFERRE